MSKPVYDSMPVEEFIRKYGTPYDPAADDYDRPPFIADIKEGKNDPIYNAHSYHTKVPPRAIIPYILHYTEPGDIVLDPFCGSGMTGVAAMLCEDPPKDLLEMAQAMNPDRRIKPGARRVILNDLSPAACHIAYNYCTPVDVDELKREFERIKAAVKDEFDWLYGTKHYEPAIDLYDPQKAAVAARLKNPPPSTPSEDHPRDLFKGKPPERTWELITRAEVEKRLGSEVLADSPLPRGVDRFICIPAAIQNTIWSDVYSCEGMVSVAVPGRKTKRRVARGCGGPIVLWDVAVDRVSGAVNKEFRCPHCGQQWEKRSLTAAAITPVQISASYCDPTGTSRQVTRHRTSAERLRCSEAECLSRRRWVPTGEIDTGREMMRHGLLKRGLSRFEEFYTPRNLTGLSILFDELNKSPNPRIRAELMFAFTAIVNKASLLHFASPKGPGGVRKATLYIASLTNEINVWQHFAGRIKELAKLWAVMPRVDVAVVRRGTAARLAGVKNASVDYIFADPPFGSNIFYGDCSLLWEFWLGEFTEESKEIVVSDRRKNGPFKTLGDYASTMSICFDEMSRVLKPGRWATVEFNNSDGRVFEAIKTAAREAGFEIVNMLFLDKVQKSFKQIRGAQGEENVVGHDVLFNLHKPGPAERPKSRIAVNGEFEHLVVDAIQEHLRGLPEQIKKAPSTYSDEHRTTPFLNTMLMNALIPRGAGVDRLNLPFIDALCSRYLRKIDNRWYLPDEAVGNGQGGMTLHPVEVEITEEISAIEWLRQLLTKEPMMIGDIKPLWMRATVQLTSDLSTQLERLLRQNFWLDPTTNKWREPTDEERRRMDTTERERIRHSTERLLAGTLGEVPSDGELCRWVGVLYDATKAIEDDHAAMSGEETHVSPDEAIKVCRQIVALFQRVLAEKVDEKSYHVASRQARMAGLKIQQAEEAKPKPKPKEKTLFDP